jgi:hypothetical protein
LIRYGDLELPRDAMTRLVVALEDMREERLATKLDRAADTREELVLAPGDDIPILRAVRDGPIPELRAFADALEERSRRLEPRPLSREERATLRETRLAANEAFFRRLNESLEQDTPDDATLIVLCECADEDCAQRLELTRPEYEKVRSDPTWFVVAHTHVDPEIEVVIGRTDRFEMVQKIGVGMDVATRLDA